MPPGFRSCLLICHKSQFAPPGSLRLPGIPGDVPRGIIADMVEDLGISRDDFYFK